MIYEKVPQIGNFNFKPIIGFYRKKICEYFPKNISIGWKLNEIWYFEFLIPTFAKIRLKVQL